MTSEQTEKPGSAPGPLLVADVNSEPNVDVILQGLVAATNQLKDSEIGVTLHVSGIIVSGTLISYTAYLEELYASMRTDDAEYQTFGDLLAGVVAEVDSAFNPESTREAKQEEAEETLPPSFIHLREAVVWAPDARSVLPPALWRGRLSQVSAWSPGVFRAG
jgi:hypothetical protein